MSIIKNLAALKVFQKDLQESHKIAPQFDFARRILAAPGQSTHEIPIPAGYDFEMIGYNIDYDQDPGLGEVLSVKLSQSQGGRKWSNDFLSIKSIATPGVRGIGVPPVPRYGFRAFHAYLPQNDKIIIEIDNATQLAATLEVNFVFVGNLLQV